jgi:hypothetical protein
MLLLYGICSTPATKNGKTQMLVLFTIIITIAIMRNMHEFSNKFEISQYVYEIKAEINRGKTDHTKILTRNVFKLE